MAETADHRVEVRLDELLAARGMTLVELSARVGVTVANLSILKNGHARAIRFSTLTAICEALDCTPGQLLSLQDQQPSRASQREDTQGSNTPGRERDTPLGHT